MNVKVIIGIGIGVLLTIFIFQNAATVEIRFLFWTVSMSRVLLLGGAVIVGLLAGFTAGWEVVAKRKHASGEVHSHLR